MAAHYIRVGRAVAEASDIEYVRLEYISRPIRFSMPQRRKLPPPDAEGVRFLDIAVQPGGYEVRYYADASGPCVSRDFVYVESPTFKIAGSAERDIT